MGVTLNSVKGTFAMAGLGGVPANYEVQLRISDGTNTEELITPAPLGIVDDFVGSIDFTMQRNAILGGLSFTTVFQYFATTSFFNVTAGVATTLDTTQPLTVRLWMKNDNGTSIYLQFVTFGSAFPVA
jgi:hypothetical protein